MDIKKEIEINKKSIKSMPVVFGEGFFIISAFLKKQDNTDYSEGDASIPARYRDLEIETAEKEQKKSEELSIEELLSESDIDFNMDGYGRGKERSFDPVTDKLKTEEELREIDEQELDIPPEAVEQAKRKGRVRAISAWKFLKQLALSGTQKVIYAMDIVQEIARKAVEFISTYRFHSIYAPKDQAGIFDNKIEQEIRGAQKALRDIRNSEELGTLLGKNSLKAEQQMEKQTELGVASPDKTPLQSHQESVGMSRGAGGGGGGKGL